MVLQKVDVSIVDLTQHQEAASQLRVGELVFISQAEGSSTWLVQSQAGTQIGVLEGSGDREFLSRGNAVVRSIRRQEGAVVQVLIRVTQASPAPKSGPGGSP
jgi:hypothetical protein